MPAPGPAMTADRAENFDILIRQAGEHLRAGRPADAIEPLQQAAQVQPGNAILLHDLGLACFESNRIDDAIAALRQAAAAEPRFSDAHFHLGIALEKQGDSRGAIVAYDRATELRPDLTEAWYRAGALVYTLGHREESIGCFRRAAETGPRTSFGRLGKARALLTQDRDLEAEKVLQKTVAVEPQNALAHDLLGNLLSELGRFDEARACFERAIALAPLLAGSYYDLVRCRRITGEDAGLVGQMDAALATPGLEAAQRHRLQLALAKVHDDLGNYQNAMEHLDAADAVRRTSLAFDPLAFGAEIERMIARCTPALMARASELGRTDAMPVFIIGMPRSGTTLVEQIVSSHPQVGAGGELNYWNECGAAWHAQESAGVEPAFLARAGADYLRLLRDLAPRRARVTDKMPFNFLWAGLIHLAFPCALIIHCRRHPVDTALSIHQTHFHPALAFPTGGTELVEYMRGYRRLTDHWRTVLPPDRYIELDYEELTRDPEPVIRRIIAACGLDWNDACLQPERNPRAVKTPSKWQTRQPIYRNSVARWRRYEPWLGPLRALMDETADTPGDAAPHAEAATPSQ